MDCAFAFPISSINILKVRNDATRREIWRFDDINQLVNGYQMNRYREASGKAPAALLPLLQTRHSSVS